MPHSNKADGLLLIVTLLAAISWMFSKEALTELPPLLFISGRFLLAGALLAIIGYSALRKLQWAEIRTASAVGLLFGTSMCFWIMGLSTTSSLGEGAFITSMSVVLVPVVSWLLFRDVPTKSTWLALPTAIAGMALLALRDGYQPEASQWYFFIAAMMLSLTFILNGRAASHIPALALSAIQLTWVGILAGIASLLLETWPTVITAAAWNWLLLSVLIGTAARFLLQTYAQGLTSPSHAAVIMILEPVWTAAIAAVWFSERMSTQQWLGCALILVALMINRWQAIRRMLRPATL